MATVNLREYDHEIETLIDQNQFEQAIAHTRHILKFYPKHLGTYRLLGKAYLESQRYGDAADVFQRVLSAVPDDFVSQVGMSIIREDEGNLDEAIWHMERAFEVQPANNPIQGELRRLYGKRDGLEPPKVRLTRGALARMYIKGELYPQAIAELRAALSEDAERSDLLTLLAQAYFLTGQKVEAADTCSTLLNKMPYCLEANRILAEILADSERAREVDVFRQRMQMLDPYLAFISPATPSPESVPDHEVTLEKLIWSPGQTLPGDSTQPEWASSLGLKIDELGSAQEEMPDWLLTRPGEESKQSVPALEFDEGEEPILEVPGEPGAEEELSAEDTLPDFMKAAGWEEAGPEAEEPPQAYSIDEEGAAENDQLAPAEIPDWLKAMAPEDQVEEMDEEIEQVYPPEPEGSMLGLPWLEENSKTPAETPPELPEPEPDEVAEQWVETGSEEEPGDEMDLEFPSALDESGEAGEEIPEWLSEMPATEIEDTARETVAETPAWLDEMPEVPETESVAPAGSTEEIPEWLRDLSPEEVEVGEPAEAVDTPVLEEATHPPVAEEQVWSEEEGTPAWIDMEGAEPEERLDDESAEIEPELPVAEAELTAMDQEPEEEIPELAEESPILELEEEPEEPGIPKAPFEPAAATQMDDDAAFAWLESLAAKQGAEEALFLEPEERRDTPPDWVLEAAAQADAEPEASGEAAPLDWDNEMEETVAPEGEAEAEALPADELPEWLRSSDQDEWLPISQAPTGLESSAEEGYEHGEEAAAVEPSSEEEGEAAMEDTGLPDWLRQEAQTPEEAAAYEMELPEWLGETETPSEEAALPASDLPDWLKQTEVEEGAISPIPEGIAASSQLPDWLQGSGSEPKTGELASMEMLFGPKVLAEAETRATEAEPLTLEEPPIIEGDTQPTRVRPTAELAEPMESSGIVTPAEIAEFPETESALPTEELPEWLKDLSAPEVAEEEKAGKVFEVTEDLTGEPLPVELDSEIEIPIVAVTAIEPGEEWEGEPSGEEVSLAEEFEPGEAAEAYQAVSEGEEEISMQPSVEGAGSEDEAVGVPLEDEAAFAWLEGLAAKQGAEEAMLLTPEERLDVPPEWVQEAMAESAPEMHPEAMGEEAPTAEITEPPSEVEVPELPSWLEDVEEAEPREEEAAWNPPFAESFSGQEELQAEMPVEETTEAEALPVEAEAGAIDLNQAGLVDLERLPGVGYIRAQAILEYRQEHGAFTSLNELLNIPGIEPSLLDEIGDLLTVEAPEMEEPSLQMADEKEVTLIQARNAIVQGEPDRAIEYYQSLIKSPQFLNEVISDLSEALYRYPVQVNIWQTLGDAYLRNGNLQQALDSYTKAEELIR